MITAKEARKATEERLKVLAKEFVLNKVDPLIHKAIDKGRSDTVVDLTNSDFSIPNLEFVGPEIVKLLKGLECRINLIRYHTIPDVDLKESDERRMEDMRDYLTNHGIFTTIRASRGQDIFAACGLLSTAKKDGLKI